MGKNRRGFRRKVGYIKKGNRDNGKSENWRGRIDENKGREYLRYCGKEISDGKCGIDRRDCRN